MKRVILFLCCFIFTTVNIHSQNESIEDISFKFAFINSYAFSDKKTGITELAQAYTQLGSSLCFTPASKYEAEWKRTEKILIEPVNNKIKFSISEIKNRGNLKLLNLPDIDDGSVLAINNKLDITERFISDYNKKIDFQKDSLTYNVPKSRIAVIDSTKFFDNLNGIKNLAGYKDLDSACNNGTDLCKELFAYLRSYPEANNFGIILDSSRETPLELKGLKTFDITTEFISQYNKSNK